MWPWEREVCSPEKEEEKKKSKEKHHQVSTYKLQLQICYWSTAISDVKQNRKHSQLVTGIQKEK